MTSIAVRRDRPAVELSSADRGRGARIAGATVAVATFVAYLPGLGRALDFDSAETVGVFIKPGPPWGGFERQAVFNNHPLFSFLEQIVRVVTGNVDAATMRLLPIAFGAATVGVLTWHCARRFNVLAGVAGGLVVAANPTFEALSRSVRGYTLLTLCAVISTVIVIDELTGTRERTRGRDIAYLIAAAAGVATHLFMVPVLVVHAAAVASSRQLDVRWRARLLGALALGACAYAGMAYAMFEASAAHERSFQAWLPWDVGWMALGGGVAALLLLPLIAVGTARLLQSGSGRGAAAALALTFLFLWAVQQSSALTDRFFLWVIPAVGYLVAMGLARVPGLSVVAALAIVAMVSSFAPSFRDEPTSYPQAAALIETVNHGGARSCVVDVGVLPMWAYLDDADFTSLTKVEQLPSCDVVVVAANWPSNEPWYAVDNEIIAAAKQRGDVQTILPSDDPTLVFSTHPLSTWGAAP